MFRRLTSSHPLFHSLSHEHILQSFGYFPSTDCVTLVLEYAPLGNLYELLRNADDDKLSLDIAQNFVGQVTSALAYLESQHVAHRDIKSENIVLTSESTVKLCDFGYAVTAPPPNDIRTTFCGTPEFVPPEMLTLPSSEREYAAGYVDRWALGVLAYELVMGRSPFYLEKCEEEKIASVYGYKEKYRAIFVGIRKYTALKRPAGCDETLFEFCSLLMQRKPHCRMGAKDALKHAWLCGTSSCKESSRRAGERSSRRATKRAKTQVV